MDFEEIKNSVNEWLWDSELNTYFWILGTDANTKTIQVRGLSGRQTDLIFSRDRFFMNMKPTKK